MRFCLALLLLVFLSACFQEPLAEERECFRGLNTQVDAFAEALEKATNKNEPSSTIFDPPDCLPGDVSVGFERLGSYRACSLQCKREAKDCLVVGYSLPLYRYRRCLGTPRAVYFPDSNQCGGLRIDDRAVLDVRALSSLERLAPGTYFFENIGSGKAESPHICVFHRAIESS